MKMLRKVIVILLICFARSSVGLAEGYSMTQSTYKSLQDIQKIITEEKFSQAVTELNKLLLDVEKDTMDEAVVLQTLGYAEMGLTQYDQAIKYFKTSINLAKLPESAELNMRYLVAQLLASQGKFDEALSYAQIWYARLKKPQPAHHVFIGNLQAQLKHFKEAIVLVRKGIDESDAPRESWYQLLIACHFELKQYPETASALREALAYWPEKKVYWEQLASINMLLDNESEALAVLQIAWRQGVVEKESSIRTLMQFAINRGIPERAARILEQSISDKVIEANIKNLEVLSVAWGASKETDKAIDSLNRLAAVSPDGQPLVRLARLYVDKEDWKKAQTSLKQGIEKGLKDEARAWLLLGIAYIQDNKFDEGKSALKKAGAFEHQEKQAAAWLKYADQKLQNQNWLSRSS